MKIETLIERLPHHASKRYKRRNMAQVDTFVLHHSGEAPPRDGAWVKQIFSFARYHVRDQGWPGIAYHYVIAPDGHIFKCQPLDRISYHAAGANARGIGICLLGDFRKGPPTKAQLSAARELIAAVRVHHDVPRAIGHREVRNSTICPGPNFTREMIRELGED